MTMTAIESHISREEKTLNNLPSYIPKDIIIYVYKVNAFGTAYKVTLAGGKWW
jgi:hypothetical protein